MIIAGLAATIIGFSSCCGNSAKCENDSAAKCDSVCEKQPCCQTTPDEIDGIKKALGYYTEAAVNGDSKIAMQGFAPAATMSYAEGDSLVTVPIQVLYDYYDQTGPHKATYEIASCSVAGDVAMVRIESKFGENEFTDMFTLVKADSDWKIVSKVYQPK